MTAQRQRGAASRDTAGSNTYVASVAAVAGLVFIQSISAGEFLTSVVPQPVREMWKTIHGYTAYPIMIAALVAVITIISKAHSIRGVPLATVALSAATIAQWLTGHAISTWGWNWVIPIHVSLVFVVYGLAISLTAYAIWSRRRRDRP